MKKWIPVFIMALMLSSCYHSKKMHFYNAYKKEVVKNIFVEFEKHLPAPYEKSIMAQIRYAPSYKALGCSGIDVLYSLNNSNFAKNLYELHNENIISKNLLYDSVNFDRSNTEYYSFLYKQQKIVIPRVNEDFCEGNDTCFKWNDLDIVILKTGTKKVFSKNVDPEYRPKDINCNYSIGALISKKKRQIIYWLFIYK